VELCCAGEVRDDLVVGEVADELRQIRRVEPSEREIFGRELALRVPLAANVVLRPHAEDLGGRKGAVTAHAAIDQLVHFLVGECIEPARDEQLACIVDRLRGDSRDRESPTVAGIHAAMARGLLGCADDAGRGREHGGSFDGVRREVAGLGLAGDERRVLVGRHPEIGIRVEELRTTGELAVVVQAVRTADREHRLETRRVSVGHGIDEHLVDEALDRDDVVDLVGLRQRGEAFDERLAHERGVLGPREAVAGVGAQLRCDAEDRTRVARRQ
jgi:hypothetical protein